MDTNQIFLIEVLVDKVTFAPGIIEPIPQKKQLSIFVQFGNFAVLEIRSDGLGQDTSEKSGSKKREVEFNSGKSYLFATHPDHLINALTVSPLEIGITLRNNPTPIGKATIAWRNEFIDMIQSAKESAGYVTPASFNETLPMMSKEDDTKVMGNVDVFFRLSCFGTSISTPFQVVQPPTNTTDKPRQFLFKSTNTGTTFQCEKYGYGLSSELLPVAPIFNAVEIDAARQRKRDAMSWERVFATPYEPTASTCPSDFNVGFVSKGRDFDEVSIVSRQSLQVRPDEKRYINLLTAMDSHAGGSRRTSMDSVTVEDELTVDKINESLCGCNDCPAVIKFKEFGIGPLATGRGLGAVTGPQLPARTSFGVSNTYGTLDTYGAYGAFLNPPDSGNTTAKNGCDSHRLRGGGSDRHFNESRRNAELLQMRAIRAGIDDDVACRKIMTGFDTVLDSYKKCLGPCGTTTCPLTTNFLDCSKLCHREYGGNGLNRCDRSLPRAKRRERAGSCHDTKGPCGGPGCPLRPPEEAPSCGDPDVEPCMDISCPYAPLPRCDNAKCPFRKRSVKACDDDPLLVEPCLDVSCPYTPHPSCNDGNRPAAKKTYKQKSCFDDDADDGCAPPPLCVNPSCPIKAANCTYTVRTKEETFAPCAGNDSVCRFAPPPLPSCFKPKPNICSHPEWHRASPPSCNRPSVVPCSDPSCPFTPTPPPNICDNPKCPFNRDPPPPPCCPLCPQEQPMFEPCSAPDCPFAAGAVCQSPDCPFAVPDDPCNKNTCTFLNDYAKCTKCKGLSRSGATCDSPRLEVPGAEHYAPTSGGETSAKRTAKKTDAKDDKDARVDKKQQRRKRFCYDEGDLYPGVKVGHRGCNSRSGYTVPNNMGWLWNSRDAYGHVLKPRGKGWRPGAMAKVIADRIKKHREAQRCEPLNLFGEFKKKTKKPLAASDSNVNVPDRPTLRVKKEHGVYRITMNPLKDPRALAMETNESPYLDCTPMEFKIVRNRSKLRLVQGDEDDELYRNCRCCADDEESTASSTDSELDIEFTPPAGVIHPEMRKKKHNVVHADTQYAAVDFALSEIVARGATKKGKGAAKGKGTKKGKKGK